MKSAVVAQQLIISVCHNLCLCVTEAPEKEKSVWISVIVVVITSEMCLENHGGAEYIK